MNPHRQKNQMSGAHECESEARRTGSAFTQNAGDEQQAHRHRPSHGLWLGWKVELPRGRHIPLGYGLAWVDMSRWVAVCVPWPLNLIARWWRAGNWRLRHVGRALAGPGVDAQFVADSQRVFREEQALAEQYAAGYLSGWQECFDACLEAVEEELGTPRRRHRPAPQRATRAACDSDRGAAGKSNCGTADESVGVEPIIDRLKVN